MAQGCYTEPYLPGSFKAIPFNAVVEADSEHGRRGAEGEFPFGEQTAYADLGRKIRRYNIRARFDSNDHVLEAAALIAAVELPGPGPLVHPTRGVILSAACVGLKVTDKPEEEGGVTYVDMQFVEANNWPNGLSLVGQILGLAIAPLITSARDSFTSRYNPGAVQTYREDAVVDATQEQISNIVTQYSVATQTQSGEDARNQVIYELNVVARTDAEAATTATADRALVLGMAAVAQNLSGTAKFNAFRTLANGAAKTSTFLAPASDAENAVYNLVRVVAAAYMAEGALEETEYRAREILEQAYAIDNLITQEMSYARDVCENHLHNELAKFRVEVSRQLSQKANDAPGLIEYDFGGPVHPLVAAYSIHGDAKRHRELEGFNPIGALGRATGGVIAAGV